MSEVSPKRFAYSVIKDGEDALVTMDCSDGMMRSRHMPAELLELIGQMFRELKKAADVMLPDAEVPDFPGIRHLVDGVIEGVCLARIGAHRRGGQVKRVLALYDEDDESAPVLLLIEEQIDEFINQA